MTDLTLTGSPVRMLSHMMLAGTAAILRDGPDRTATFNWHEGTATAELHTALGEGDVGQAVRSHAESRLDSWLQAEISTGPRAGMSLFSPRIKSATDEDDRRLAAMARYAWLRERASSMTALDHALIGGLGEPAWWRASRTEARPDDGASRWEMKTRNRGEEFVKGRLRPLTEAVAQRDGKLVLAGLLGDVIVDETASSPADSRTATGLTLPGPTDSAVAYCALHGIALLPTVRMMGGVAASPGLVPLRGPRRGVHPQIAFLPVFTTPVSPRRFTAIATSRMLEEAARTAIDAGNAQPLGGALAEQGVHGIVICEVNVTGSQSAPERQMLDGTIAVL